MSRHPRSTTLLLASSLALLAVACPSERAPELSQSLSLGEVTVIGERLAWLDRTRDRVTLLAPLTGEVQNVGLAPAPGYMTSTPDDSRLLVLTEGRIATEAGDETEPPWLFVVNPATGEARDFELTSPFDRVTGSDDNRYAVAFFAAEEEQAGGEVFRNPNSVAIADLDAGEVTAKNVRSFGDVPLGVVFSPSTFTPLSADGDPGAARTLAVVFAEGYLTILDVAAPERREVTVRLTLPGSGLSVVPDRLVFVPEAGTAYLRASGSNDIFVLTLTSRAPVDEEQNDFVVSINTLAAGTGPADLISFVPTGGRRKILVANQQSQDLTVIDGRSSEFFTIPVGAPVDRVLGYPADDPTTAVVFSQALRGREVHLVSLTDIDALRGSALTTLDAAARVGNIELVPQRPLALVRHDDPSAALSVLDLTDGTLSPLTGNGVLDQLAITADGSALAGTVVGSLTRLGIIDLAQITTRTLILEEAAERVFALRGADDGGRAVVVLHDDLLGRVTVVPDARSAAPEDLFVLSGFLLEGVFDEPREWELPEEEGGAR